MQRPSLDEIFKQPPTAPQRPSLDSIFGSQPGFLDRVGQDISKRQSEFQDIKKATLSGDQSIAEGALQTFAKTGLGTLNDIAGEALQSGYEAMPSTAVGRVIKSGAANLANSPLFSENAPSPKDIMGSAAEKYAGFAEQNPRAARNIESVANIALTFPASKTAAKAVSGADDVGKAASYVGNKSYESGVKSAAKMRSNFIDDLITPKLTEGTKRELFESSVESGPLRQAIPQKSPFQQSIANDIAGIESVSKYKSLLGNKVAIEDALGTEAQNLVLALRQGAAKGARISDDAILSKLSQVKSNLADNVYITASGESAQKTVDNVIDKALTIISKHPRTPEGLLKARQELDGLIKLQKGQKFFDSSIEAPISQSLLETRMAINDLIAEAVPDEAVKRSLQKQSNYYRALDAINTKGGAQGKNRLTRAAKGAYDAIGLKGTIAASGAAAGLGATVGPTILSAAPYAAAAYGAYKGITSPALRKGIGSALKAGGELMQGAGPSGVSLPAAAAYPAALGAQQMAEQPEQPQSPMQPQMQQPTQTVVEPLSYNTTQQPDILDKISQAESGGNTNARNPVS